MVTEYLVSPIAKQVEENSLVVWYDPGAHYLAVAERLEIPAGLLPNSCGSWGHGVKLCMGLWRQALFFVFISGCAPRIRKMPSIKCEVPNLMDDFSRAPTESRIIEESRLTVGVRKRPAMYIGTTAFSGFISYLICPVALLLGNAPIDSPLPLAKADLWSKPMLPYRSKNYQAGRIAPFEEHLDRGSRHLPEGTILNALSEELTVEVRQTHRTDTFAFRRGIRESSHASTTKSDSSATRLLGSPLTPPYSK